MRYHVLACDYDGTIAHNEIVAASTLEQLKKIKLTGRKIVLVTGREIPDLERVFPEYRVFDYIVAENGALILDIASCKEQLLGPAPDAAFVQALKENGVAPLSVGKVIIATWEPHQITVLKIIKEYGYERQIIFNKGAVMILPPGLNKATGLLTLLKSLHLSAHNTVAVGDAENDSAMLQAVECSVAVDNALSSLKEIADYVTPSNHGSGVSELIDELINDDLHIADEKLSRHCFEIGAILDSEKSFAISPFRTGILLSGVSGGGKTTLTLTFVESLAEKKYQFCLVDPEGDYVELTGAVVVGDEKKLPSINEITELFLQPEQNVVICMLSVPLDERPLFFSDLMEALISLRAKYGHPHWIIADEAHHLLPEGVNTAGFKELNNFILASTAPDKISANVLSDIGMVITVGDNPSYPFEQFAKVLKLTPPEKISSLQRGQCCIWDVEKDQPVYIIEIKKPTQLMQRHKRKYAQGDMGDNSFVFTGDKKKLRLKATNLMMFVHLAQGIDDDTWLYHLHRNDYSNWFDKYIHDETLGAIAREAEKSKDALTSKKIIIDYINDNYTG